MTPLQFAEKRRSLGLSQEALAHRMGITVRQMIRIEGGSSIPLKYQLALRMIEVDMRAEVKA